MAKEDEGLMNAGLGGVSSIAAATSQKWLDADLAEDLRVRATAFVCVLQD